MRPWIKTVLLLIVGVIIGIAGTLVVTVYLYQRQSDQLLKLSESHESWVLLAVVVPDGHVGDEYQLRRRVRKYLSEHYRWEYVTTEKRLGHHGIVFRPRPRQLTLCAP